MVKLSKLVLINIFLLSSSLHFCIVAQSVHENLGQKTATYDPNSSIITNDIWWKDNNGNDILASMGGHITKVDETYYWIGNNPNSAADGFDIHLYSSKTLGSNSWKHEGKLIDFPRNRGEQNCTLLHSPATGNYVIVAKSGLVFYESENITGPYVKKNTILKNQLGGRTNYKVGGMGTFQDGENAYVITSRRWLGDATPTKPLNHRYTGIYKLTPDFLDIEEEVSWIRNDSREAMWLFKKDNTYYMTASHTAGWTASACYYRTSTNLVDWSEEKEIGMNPERPGGSQANKIMRSHGTQHRWITKLGDQFVYAGDRYPYQEEESHPFEKGLYLMCPVDWDGDKPIVRYEKSWSVQNSALSIKDNSMKDQLQLISQNFPNPFSEKTSITYHIPNNIGSNDKTVVKIYNVTGQLVSQLLNEYKSPGDYTIQWDGTNKNGHKVAYGIYILEMTAGHQKNKIKLLYSK